MASPGVGSLKEKLGLKHLERSVFVESTYKLVQEKFFSAITRFDLECTKLFDHSSARARFSHTNPKCQCFCFCSFGPDFAHSKSNLVLIACHVSLYATFNVDDV